MARIETWFDQDLKNPVPVRVLTGSAFSLDNLGNLIGVKVTDGGEVITLSGNVNGYCMLADGQTIPVNGSRSGNMASIVLPQTAYTVPGPIQISIKLTEGSAITTLLACVGTVIRTQTGNIVNPGSVVQDWSTQISAQLQACQDAADAMGSMVAVAFNPSSVYAAGNYVTYNGGLYRITATHAAGTTWADTSKTQVTVGAELSDLNQAFDVLNGDDGVHITNSSVSAYGVTAAYDNGRVKIYGTGTANRFMLVFNTNWVLIPSTTNPGQPIPAGLYKLNLSVSGVQSNIGIYYTKTTYASLTHIVSEQIFNVDEAFSCAIYVQNNVNYGTEEAPTYIDISLSLIEEKVPYRVVNAYRDEQNDVNELVNGKIDALNGNRLVYPTEFISPILANGVTVVYENGRIKAFGTSSGTRFVTLFNKTVRAFTSASPFTQTFPIGAYALHVSVTGYAAEQSSKDLYYTTTTFADIHYAGDNECIITESPIMVGLGLISSRDYGTENNPTYFEITIEKYTEKLDTESVESMIEDTNVVTYTEFADGYIDTSGAIGTIISLTPTASSSYRHIIVPCNEGDSFIMQTRGGGASALYYVWCDSQYKILSKSHTFPISEQYTMPWFLYAKPNTAPPNAKYLVANHRIDLSPGDINLQGYAPAIYKLPKSKMAVYMAQCAGDLPYLAKNEWEYRVVSAYKSMIVILDEDGMLKLSRDCGKTWNSGVDVSGVGTIVNYHLFNDGGLSFFTDTKAYYIEDWQTYNESTCYEQDGVTVFVPQSHSNFDGLWDHAERKFIGSQDMHVFSNYNLEREGYRRILWYSIDNGHTYKIAYEFSLPETYEARHIHEVIYYEPEDVYIVTTGDHNATECRVLALKYDVSQDSWTASVLGGPSRDYKWACIAIWADKIYYTFDSAPGKVLACDYADIGDISKHETILSGMECDSLALIFSLTGELIVIQSTVRSLGGQVVPIGMTPYEATRKIYYSSDRKNFVTVIIPINYINGNAIQYKIKPITSDGHCYIGTSYFNQVPSLRADDYLHYCGYKTAFRPF